MGKWLRIMSFRMMSRTTWLGTILAIALMAGTSAAETVASGKIKSVNADNKTFALAEDTGKDYTFKFGEHLVINRAGKEGTSDLKPGDAISVCYDKGALTWKAHYIFMREGASKNSELIRGNVKEYDADKKELINTGVAKKDLTSAVGNAAVRLNMEAAKIEDVKIGDHVLLIVDTVEGKSTLQSVMVDRSK